jgi:Mg-chelatase subunit ChlD
MVRLSGPVIAAVMAWAGAAPQSAAPAHIYVEGPSSPPTAYAVDVDGTVVASTLTPGPQPLSVIVLYDVSDSMRSGSLDPATRRIASGVRAGDAIRVGTFADRILIGATPVVDRASATMAAREVTQTGGASPLWDALCVSVDALRKAEGLRAVVIVSDGLATGNDRGIEEAYELATPSGVIVSVVGVADSALMVSRQMEILGRNDALRRLARDTGGRYSELKKPGGDPVPLVVSALDDLRNRTRLAFVPPVRDGAVHRVGVALHGRPVPAPVRLQF